MNSDKIPPTSFASGMRLMWQSKLVQSPSCICSLKALVDDEGSTRTAEQEHTARRLSLASSARACCSALPSMMSAWPPGGGRLLRDAPQHISQLLAHRRPRQRLCFFHPPRVFQRAHLLDSPGSLGVRSRCPNFP